MIILGIDPGTARMGYAVLEHLPRSKKKTSLVEHGTLVTPKDLDMPKRLKILYKGLLDLLKKHNPEIMVIERLFFSANAKTAIEVGQARGVSMLAAASKKLKVSEYTALEAKLILTGYGRSDKKTVQEAVRQHLSLDSVVKSDDANDAVAIALCYIMKPKTI